MKQRILTKEAAETLRKFDPKYYPLLVAYIWYEFNVLKSGFVSLRQYTKEENNNLCFKTEKLLDFYKSEATIEVDQDEPDIKNTFEVSEKPWTIWTIFNNLSTSSWFATCTTIISIIAGFILGYFSYGRLA